MPLDFWLWLVFVSVGSIACIRQYRLMLKEPALPDDWPRRGADREGPEESNHVADQ